MTRHIITIDDATDALAPAKIVNVASSHSATGSSKKLVACASEYIVYNQGKIELETSDLEHAVRYYNNLP